ncbi:hypothetical protein [Streptomyces sp. NBC_01233]|uniref:hypothetical protein n=1 Tax=Streptomyces sp. NBC_01233 TaxID=2903787 RepID=UPI002E0F2135|nr:hypothetical protein OG332_00170 [Streptomyces sp. NBC_01233]WSP95316.1 hypothetical protein OG332_46815 [Streptomyces sp. NBC_01233]
MKATPILVPPAERPPDSTWWLAPALFTVAAVLGGAWGYRSSPIVQGAAWLALPYVVPLALVAASWRSSAHRNTRTRGLVLGGIGALIALVYAHLATFVLCAVALVLWAFQGGG